MSSWYGFQIFLNFLLLSRWLWLILVQSYISCSNIHCISLYKPLNFCFFSASFCMTLLSTSIVLSINMHVFSFLFLLHLAYLPWLLYLCVPLDSIILSHLYVHILCVCVCVCVCVRAARACVYTICLSIWSLVFCILSNVNVQKLPVSSLMSPNFSHRYDRLLSSSFSSKLCENYPSLLFPCPFCHLLCFALPYLCCSSLQFSLEASTCL